MCFAVGIFKICKILKEILLYNIKQKFAISLVVEGPLIIDLCNLDWELHL
jgi:hypothetical protein